MVLLLNSYRPTEGRSLEEAIPSLGFVSSRESYEISQNSTPCPQDKTHVLLCAEGSSSQSHASGIPEIGFVMRKERLGLGLSWIQLPLAISRQK